MYANEILFIPIQNLKFNFDTKPVKLKQNINIKETFSAYKI